MRHFSDRLTAHNALLASYAVPFGGTLGREHAEAPDETRFPFQRDRGRIIHSQAFRRLQGKTQVFVSGEGDHFRTRLTHTMEVAQLSRDIARTMSLNEDLAECIALAHDLGHPPFAHMGEQALDAWMRAHDSHFEHNEQSLRIVTTLEDHSPNFLGLNLNREILEGMQKHRSSSDDHPRALSLEAQAVNIADEIAYSAHDCDDGLRAELFTMTELRTLPIIRMTEERKGNRGTSLRGALIQLLVDDLYAETEKRITAAKIQSLDDVYNAKEHLVMFSSEIQKQIAALHAFLFEHMYMHPRVRSANVEGQKILAELCDRLLQSPTDKITALQKRTGSTLNDAVKDYVAGMTDSFASKSIPKP